MTYKVFIDGAEGTTGLKLKQRLLSHPEISLIELNENKRKDIKSRLDVLEKVDLAFLCLPDQVSIDIVKLIENSKIKDLKIIDASTAHRTSYGWTYGFPELIESQLAKIKTANRISNPGCYPTGALSIIRPLIENGLLKKSSPLIIHAISGYSGGGKNLIQHFSNNNSEKFVHYGFDLNHKHLKEIKKYSKLETMPIFCPSVGSFYNGMCVSIPLHYDWLEKNVSGEKIRNVLYEWYKNNFFIAVSELNDKEILSKNGFLNPEKLKGTNNLEISVFANENSGQVWITANFDNLGKGASGAAIQNMNIMFNLPENLSL